MGGLHQETKAALRRLLSERRAELRPEHLAATSARICARIVETLVFEHAQHVVVYVARGSEIDPGAIATAAVARGVPTYYPRVEGRDLVFCAATHASLGPGRYGIPEPLAGASPLPDDADGPLIIVPGLAFDWNGGRLGTGLGYYDRALRRHPSATRIGIAVHAFVVDALPMDHWDVPMHAIATERGVFTAGGSVGVQPGDDS